MSPFFPEFTLMKAGNGPRRSSTACSLSAALNQVKLAHRQSVRLRSMRLESTAITATSVSSAADSA